MEEIRIALQGLRLSGMAEKWVSLFETRQADRLTLADGLQLLLQAERDTRNCNKVNRLLKIPNETLAVLILYICQD